MKSCHVLHAILVGCLATSMPASAAPSPTSQTSAPRRLTVTDFMGTWKIFARTPMGGDAFPSIRKIYDSAINTTISLSEEIATSSKGNILLYQTTCRKPLYKVVDINFKPNTLYPEINGLYTPEFPFIRGHSIILKVGCKAITGKYKGKYFFEWLQAGSNIKTHHLTLTASTDGGAFFLCKINPKTGQCQDHP